MFERAGRKRLRIRGSLGVQMMGIRPSNQPQALLELGCGAGRVAVFLAAMPRLTVVFDGVEQV